MDSLSLDSPTEAELLQLISALNERQPLGAEERALLRRARHPDFLKDSPDVIAHKVAKLREEVNPLAFLNAPRSSVKEFLKVRDNDLAFQIRVVRDSFSYFIRTGETPAPHYANRISIVLRKLGMTELEKAFLDSWLKHFSGSAGGKYAEISKRRLSIK